MVLIDSNAISHLQHNKENALLRRGKAKHHKSKSTSHTSSPVSVPSAPSKPVTRKPRSRSHIPLPTSSTPSPVLFARKHVAAATAVRKGEVEGQDIGMNMDIEMMDSTPPVIITDSSACSSKHAIRLPRVLKKPTSMATIDPATLEVLDPELKNVPIEYVLDKLRVMGRGMLQAACSSTAQPPSDRLPRELDILIHDAVSASSFSPPSHVFAVYSRAPDDHINKPKKVTLHPAHGVVLSAHCANLPPLPVSESTSETESTMTSLKLPVVPLLLPSPNTFPLLLAYLYTKQPQGLFNALLPPTQPSLTLSNPNPPPTSSTPSSDPSLLQSPAHLAGSLAQTYTTQALLAHAARVHGLWANIVALGVADELVWKVVQIVWAVLIAALEMAAQQ